MLRKIHGVYIADDLRKKTGALPHLLCEYVSCSLVSDDLVVRTGVSVTRKVGYCHDL